MREFGWEDVWTCDGTEYIDWDRRCTTVSLAIRAAMLAVDPDDRVGVVGVRRAVRLEQLGQRGDRGCRLTALDFYIVHSYGFDRAPERSGHGRACGRAVADRDQRGPGRTPDRRSRSPSPSTTSSRTRSTTTEQHDDPDDATRCSSPTPSASCSQRACRSPISGISPTGVTSSGTDYGLLDVEDVSRFPQFEAFAAWRSMGEMLLPPQRIDDRLIVYPSTHDDGAWTILVINPSDVDVATSVSFATGEPVAGPLSLLGVWAAEASATAFEITPVVSVSEVDGVFPVVLPPWSLTTIEVPPG